MVRPAKSVGNSMRSNRSFGLGAVAMAAISASSVSSGPAAFAQSAAANPFAAPSTLPFQAPPFDRIKDSDYTPGFEEGMKQQRAEIDAIADNPAAPTFENTIVAMEKSGRMLDRVQLAFSAVSEATTNDALQKIETDITPKLTAHQDAIFLDAK